MRISRKKPNYHKINQQKRHRINEQIRVPEVRVIDENGNNIGVMNTREAMALAREKEFDLIEVSPLAKPPVVRVQDYNKIKYQEEKERRKEKAKQKKIEVKGIRLSLRISQHDIETRIRQSEKFINDEDKVKIELVLKGRERKHQDLARKIITKFIDSLNQIIPVKIEQPISAQGGRLAAILSKK